MQTLHLTVKMVLEIPINTPITNLEKEANEIAAKVTSELMLYNECEVTVIEPGMQFNETVVLIEDDKVLYSNGLTD